MGQDLADAFPRARAVFDEADRALGFPLSSLCFDGPEADLQLTANTQPAILATSIAALRALERTGCARTSWPGTASASTRRSWPPGAHAVRRGGRGAQRGQYMQEAVPVGQGAMAAILGPRPGRDRGRLRAGRAGRGGRRRPT